MIKNRKLTKKKNRKNRKMEKEKEKMEKWKSLMMIYYLMQNNKLLLWKNINN